MMTPPSSPFNWSETLAQHECWIRTVVTARLGERQAVDEVLQEVALAAVANKAPINPTKMAGWLYRLAIYQTLIWRRTSGRRRKLAGRYAEQIRCKPNDSGATVDPLGWLLHGERIEKIRTAMTQLPPRDAEILLLKYTENWSYHDLAAHLGQTEAAVESRLHRARQKLRQALTSLEVIENQP